MIPDIASREESPTLTTITQLTEHLAAHPGRTAFLWNGDGGGEDQFPPDKPMLGDRGPGDVGTLMGRSYSIGDGGEAIVEALG